MNDTVVNLLAKKLLKKGDIAAWAISCLENGFDSKSLRMLAATDRFSSPFQLDDYFKRVLGELGWDQIEKYDCLLRYSKILARRIVEDKADPVEASRDIYQILVELDYPAELQGWFDLNEMIWDYEYFLKTGRTGHFYLPKEELIGELKRVSAELIKSEEF